MIKKLQKEDINLSEWEFEFQQRGEQPISLSDFFCRSLDQYFFSEIGKPQQHANYLFTDSDKGYNNRSHKETMAKFLREIVSDPKMLQTILINSIELPKEFNKVADELTKELGDFSISNQTLARYWREMDQAFLRLIPWFYYPWYISKEDFLVNKVRTGLENYKREIETISNFEEALTATVFPTKKTGFQLEQEEMLGLVLLAEQDPSFASTSAFKEKARAYLTKYDWLTTFILSPLLPMTYEQLVERVNQAVKESFKDNFALQKKATERNEAIALKVLEIVKADPELSGDIESARELGYVLTAGIEEAYMSSARYLPFMQLVAKRIGVTFEDLKFLLSEEIANALEENRTIDLAMIDERRAGFIMMMKEGEQYVVFGADAHALSAWVDGELNKVDGTVTELKGQPACRGFAKGKARVALQPSQAHLIEEGEILVCPMTNPDYVPAMRRSAAIVTDEGGLLSHAAIMSREFNKPCVIATKIASKVLKDGDLIEVDADKGIVRIIR